MKATESALKEMAALRGGAFVEYLKAKRAETLEYLVKADDKSYKNLQGRADELQEMIDSIEGSRDRLEASKQGRVPMKGAF